MLKLRITVAGMMLLVLFIGVGAYATIHPGPLIANALFSMTLAVLTLATLGAVFDPSGSRIFWRGLALVGWLYFLVALGPAPLEPTSDRLVTTALADLLYARLEYEPTSVGEAVLAEFNGVDCPGSVLSISNAPGGKTFSVDLRYQGMPVQANYGPGQLRPMGREEYRQLWHSLWCPVFALCGGVAACRFASRARPAGPSGPAA